MDRRDPLQTRAIAQAKVKTDKIDAEVLAHLLRCDYLPRVWIPDPETRHLRHLTTERANLSSDSTRVKNRIHAVLHQRLLAPPAADLFSPAGRAWLAGLALDPAGRAALASDLARHAYHDPRVRLLLTLPGVDVAVAEALFSTLGDITRFPSPDHAAAYLGLVPSTFQSGDHTYHGRITKRGRAHARWLLVQAAQHLSAHPGPLGHFFRRLAKKKNRNVAVVATARKLVTIAWHMLRNNEPYRYAQPRTTEAKLSRLRIRVTGLKRKGGNPKGAGRPPGYGSGQPTRGIPSLDHVYAANDLPPRQAGPPGEARMLDRDGLTPFAASLAQSRRIPKKTAPKPKTPAPQS